MPTLAWPTLFARKGTGAPRAKDRSRLRVGIPKVLNIWTTHQFWVGFLKALGIASENIVFSSDTSEEQGREFGKGRGTVDCCYPVKCISGHYGELIFGQKKKIDVLLSPMIHSLPSVLHGHVMDTVTCTRVMAGPENIKAGFMKERDLFAENGITYASPFVSLGDRHMVTEQLHRDLKDVFDLDLEETARAVESGYLALDSFTARARQHSREILTWCARNQKPCILVLARPYHMDTGIGHEIEAELQAHG
jgi:predicted nucleotide-binding protein (sugar kinase/HSP70/actin superfamily)